MTTKNTHISSGRTLEWRRVGKNSWKSKKLLLAKHEIKMEVERAPEAVKLDGIFVRNMVFARNLLGASEIAMAVRESRRLMRTLKI